MEEYLLEASILEASIHKAGSRKPQWLSLEKKYWNHHDKASNSVNVLDSESINKLPLKGLPLAVTD